MSAVRHAKDEFENQDHRCTSLVGGLADQLLEHIPASVARMMMYAMQDRKPSQEGLVPIPNYNFDRERDHHTDKLMEYVSRQYK
jgi:hypothetical protein